MFSKICFLKKNKFFLPKMASVTLHIPKDFWWHRIFGSATIFGVRKFWSTWSRGGVHGEVSWPIDYMYSQHKIYVSKHNATNIHVPG